MGLRMTDRLRDLLRPGEISSGSDLGGTGHSAVNFMGSTGSTPTIWLTVYDAAPEDSGGHGSLQGSRVGGERHSRRDVGRHHPVLRDADEEHIEEEAVVVGRLAAGEQQV